MREQDILLERPLSIFMRRTGDVRKERRLVKVSIERIPTGQHVAQGHRQIGERLFGYAVGNAIGGLCNARSYGCLRIAVSSQ